ncbi:deoxyribonuclease-1-like 1 isoform X1 [Anguilla rostrata]|uniref:deoxyribonuclease-1-like 1 isoform X1 n=2 Tax=Anguilla rostrata TaxID=7938 RepID=UPI0030D09600
MRCGFPLQCFLPFHLLLFLCPLGPQLSLGLKICAFNVQSFSDSKASKPKVMHNLVRIVSRCDVCLLQEVRDAQHTAVRKLLDSLNRYDEKYHYDYVASERLGRSSTYQEQYVFVYRTGSVKVLDEYQYPDKQEGDEGAFSRPPFVVKLKAPKTVIGTFVLIPLHSSPSNATKEIDELYDVFVDVQKKWKIENVMFLGDFNAACGYVAKKNRKNIRLMTMDRFYWLIGDEVDTTVRESTSCAYDRFVVHGETFLRGVEPSSAGVYKFDKKFHLKEEEALSLSDHYPIEVDLKASAQRRSEAQLSLLFITASILFLSLA